ALRDWWDPANELGFKALISLPLERAGQAVGALTFYYADPHQFGDAERHTLRAIATQLSSMAERAQQMQDLKADNQRLNALNEMLEMRVGEAEEARRLKNEFLANMSHELRTPLTSILGYTYLLQNQMGAVSPDQLGALTKIDGSANALLRLINDLLTLTELKLGRQELNLEPHDAVLLAKRAAEIVGEVPDGVTFRLLAMPDRIPLMTDGDKIVK